MNNKVIGIQCFVKYDTLYEVLKRLIDCYDIQNYTLVFGIDSCDNMPYQNRHGWIINNHKIIDLIDEYKHYHNKIIIRQNKTNLGPYSTCYELMSFCFSLSDYAIFIEDDVLLSRDSLVFYERAFELYCNDDNMFAICGGAITGQMSDSESDLFVLKKCDWVNSCEFAITKTIWEKYGAIRGSGPHGDTDFGFCCRNNKMYSICPLVARNCSIGWKHPDSYTGYYHQDIIQTRENCIPSSDKFIFDYSKYNLIKSE